MKTGGSGGQGLGTDSIGCHIKKATKPEM